jgi:hypothetical protein
MKPEDLFDPAKMPADLHWVAEQHQLQPNDPVFLLLAWHWNAIQKAEETLKAAGVEFKTALDGRIDRVAKAVEKVDSLSGKLTEVHRALTPDPEAFAKKVNEAMIPAIAAAKADIEAVQASAAKLLESAQTAHAVVQRRELLAALVAGIAFGITVMVLIFAA